MENTGYYMHFVAESREGGDEKEGCPRFIIKVMGTGHERKKAL